MQAEGLATVERESVIGDVGAQGTYRMRK